jgi:cleavage and polyadenylation specificity factor subunit 4
MHTGTGTAIGTGGDNNRLSPAPAYFTRATDPSSPSARALHDHAPGQSLPPGVATALSRLHLQSPVAQTQTQTQAQSQAQQGTSQGKGADGKVGEQGRKEEEDGEETMFDMDH